jgi:hypothetical protein
MGVAARQTRRFRPVSDSCVGVFQWSNSSVAFSSVLVVVVRPSVLASGEILIGEISGPRSDPCQIHVWESFSKKSSGVHSQPFSSSVLCRGRCHHRVSLRSLVFLSL